MKIVQINATCGIGSTGKICVGISKLLTEQGIENYILCSRSDGDPLSIPVSNLAELKLQALKSRILGNYGFNSKSATKRMIAQLERIRPDIVHLHNIHGHDCNLEMLFSWFRKNETKLVWTFHDCWAFTGYCPHYMMAKCDKWKTQCNNCAQRRLYSWFFDRSHDILARKKALFRDLDLTIVAPSEWLSSQVKQSFLKDFPIQVIYNGIDINVFNPIQSDFIEKYRLTGMKIVLAVSFEWGSRKGLDVFYELSKRLPHNYRIVLVGTDPRLDKQLPEGILSIHRTQNQRELAQIYSAADVFVNPTREEVLGLVNIEALACGTPGVTFDTGGSPECYDAKSGSVVPCDDVDALEREILRICEDHPYLQEDCLIRAGNFDQNQRYKEYLTLYERIITTRDEGN